MNETLVEKPTGRAVMRAVAERKILDAAEEVFADRGFGGASMQQIADRAELPKANLHYYFSTKENVYRNVIERIFNTWLDAANTFTEDDDPIVSLTSYIDAKMEISRLHPAGSKVWAAEILHGAPIVGAYLQGELRSWMAERETAIKRWIEADLIEDIEPRNLIYVIWATTQHYADFYLQIRALNENEDLTLADWARAKADVIKIILNGVRKN